jgi:hypothetical protein
MFLGENVEWKPGMFFRAEADTWADQIIFYLTKELSQLPAFFWAKAW